MKKQTLLLLIILPILFVSCTHHSKETELKAFIDRHIEKIKLLNESANLTYWNAAVTGEDSLYDKYSQLELQIRKIYSDSSDYAFLKDIKASDAVKNPLLARQLDVLLNAYLENQIDPLLLEKIVTLSADIEKKFSTFRGTIDGKKVTTNQINQILTSEIQSKKRQKAWLASKQVGPVVARDIIQLVKYRNQAAQKLGFETYYTMALKMHEQDVDAINQLFDELYGLTYQPFDNLKADLDQILANMYQVKSDELMPWHYHDSFFQETPLVYNLDLDKYYQDQDIKTLAAQFYEGIGLPVQDILAKSDLYEKPKKNPHAFCTNIDRKGDIRVLCNIKPTERWMETMLHELGHAVYDKNIDTDLPYLLQEPAHIFTTEAIAMLFGRLSRNGAWMQPMLGLSQEDRTEIDQVSKKYARMKQLIFARWAMVMFKFEQELYRDPDQDLNQLWWDLKAKYQLLQKPKRRDEPDWASKIHFTIAPCYYHNYLLGELLASQLHHQIVTQVLKLEDSTQVGYVNCPEVGNYLKNNVFKAGASLTWNEMIRQATGEYLNPKYFVDQFVK